MLLLCLRGSMEHVLMEDTGLVSSGSLPGCSIVTTFVTSASTRASSSAADPERPRRTCTQTSALSALWVCPAHRKKRTQNAFMYCLRHTTFTRPYLIRFNHGEICDCLIIAYTLFRMFSLGNKCTRCFICLRVVV